MDKSKIAIEEPGISLIDNVPGIDFIDDDFAIFNSLDDIPLLGRPVRLQLVVFAVCVKGSVKMRINMEEYSVDANHIVFTLPDQILQVGERSDDCEGLLIVVSKAMMQELIPHIQDTLSAFFMIKEHPVSPLTPAEVQIIQEYHAFLWKQVKRRENPFRREVVMGLLLALFHEVSGMFELHAPVEVKKTRQEELFGNFMRQLALHYTHERSVSFYADRLCVSPKYLSLLVKNVSHRTPVEWIDERVILEAKALLSSSTLSVQEISDRLHFANQSFFGKFFKKHVGVSPLAYRRGK